MTDCANFIHIKQKGLHLHMCKAFIAQGGLTMCPYDKADCDINCNSYIAEVHPACVIDPTMKCIRLDKPLQCEDCPVGDERE